MSEPRANRRGIRLTRGHVVVAVLALFAAVVYAAVVALYTLNEGAVTAIGCTGEPDPKAITMEFAPTAVEAGSDRLAASVNVRSFGPVADADSGSPVVPLRLVVANNDGPSSFDIEPDSIPSALSLDLITDGYIERWPFDTHTADLEFVVVSDPGTPDAAGVPLVLCGSAHVPGWTFSSEEFTSDTLVVEGEAVEAARVTAARAPASVAFGMVILVLMIVMPVLCLSVAISVLRGRRKVEATLMSWMAAMLFATIPLRTFLPGSPPIGSWVDYLVVLWVFVGLVTALVVYVVAWMRWAPPGGAAR